MPARTPAEKPGTPATSKEPARQPAELGLAAPALGQQPALPPADILQLQRVVGNRAVGQLLRTPLPRGTGAALVQEAARAGVSGPSVPLPHRERIQQAFGHHDLSAVQAHTDPAAAQIARALHAHAYATGNAIAFDRPDPDLRTAAHEAAHTIQQRGGVQLKGGIGVAGDAYERAADAVAERVVQGQSAEDLLDAYAPAGAAPPARPAVQGDEFTDFILQLIEDNQFFVISAVILLCETLGFTELTRTALRLLGLIEDQGQQPAPAGQQLALNAPPAAGPALGQPPPAAVVGQQQPALNAPAVHAPAAGQPPAPPNAPPAAGLQPQPALNAPAVHAPAAGQPPAPPNAPPAAGLQPQPALNAPAVHAPPAPALGQQPPAGPIVPQIDALVVRLPQPDAPAPEGALAPPDQAAGPPAAAADNQAAPGALFVPLKALQQIRQLGQQAMGGHGFISLERLAELARAASGSAGSGQALALPQPAAAGGGQALALPQPAAAGGGQALALPQPAAAQAGALYLNLDGLAELLAGAERERGVISLDIGSLLRTEQQLLALDDRQDGAALAAPAPIQPADAPRLLPALEQLPQPLLGQLPLLGQGFLRGLHQQVPALEDLADMLRRQHAMVLVRQPQFALVPDQAAAAINPQQAAAINQATQQAISALPLSVLMMLAQLPLEAITHVVPPPMPGLSLSTMIRAAIARKIQAAAPNPNPAAAPAFAFPQDAAAIDRIQEYVVAMFPNLTVERAEYTSQQSPLFQLSLNALAALEAKTLPIARPKLGQGLFAFVANPRERALVAPAILRYLTATYPNLHIGRADLDVQNHNIYKSRHPTLDSANRYATIAANGRAFAPRNDKEPGEDVRREAMLRYVQQNLPLFNMTREMIDHGGCILYHLSRAQLRRVHDKLSGKMVAVWAQEGMPEGRGFDNQSYLVPVYIQDLRFRGQLLRISSEIFADWFAPPDAQHGISVQQLITWIGNIVEENQDQKAAGASLQKELAKIVRSSTDQDPRLIYDGKNTYPRMVFSKDGRLLITAFLRK